MKKNTLNKGCHVAGFSQTETIPLFVGLVYSLEEIAKENQFLLYCLWPQLKN